MSRQSKFDSKWWDIPVKSPTNRQTSFKKIATKKSKGKRK